MGQIVKFLYGSTATGRQNYDTKQAAGELEGGIYFDKYHRQILMDGIVLNNNITVTKKTDENTGAEITDYTFDGENGQKYTIQSAGQVENPAVTDNVFTAIKDYKGGLLTPDQVAVLNRMIADFGYVMEEKTIEDETYKGYTQKTGVGQNFWESLD